MKYRISWEMPSPIFCSTLEERQGEDVWKRLGQDVWDRLPWAKTQRVTEDIDVLDQAKQLQEWERTHEQPIRNVKLEYTETKEVWCEVKNES